MSRVLGALKKDEGVCCCKYCDCVFAYKNDDIKKEKKSEVDYFGVETWERKTITCPKCKREITSGWR